MNAEHGRAPRHQVLVVPGGFGTRELLDDQEFEGSECRGGVFRSQWMVGRDPMATVAGRDSHSANGFPSRTARSSCGIISIRMICLGRLDRTKPGSEKSLLLFGAPRGCDGVRVQSFELRPREPKFGRQALVLVLEARVEHFRIVGVDRN